jgi:hypothetical protein
MDLHFNSIITGGRIATFFKKERPINHLRPLPKNGIQNNYIYMHQEQDA